MMEIPITQARKSLFFMSSFGSDTPFMLLAKLKVKEDKLAEYLEIADKTDKAVEADEPGMLHHTFDQDPDCLLYTSPSPRDQLTSRMPSSA